MSDKEPRITLKALIIALGLIAFIASGLFVISIYAIPEAGVSKRLLLSIIGAALLGAAGFISGLRDAVDLVANWSWKTVHDSHEGKPILNVSSSAKKRTSKRLVERSDMGKLYHSCFISYSSKDREFADILNADLEHHGVETWFAPRDLRIGSKMRITFDDAVQGKDKLLLILSTASVGSDWVEQEVEAAFEQERELGSLILFPIRIDNSVMREHSGWAAHIKRTRHIGDFRGWKQEDVYQNALNQLLENLRLD